MIRRYRNPAPRIGQFIVLLVACGLVWQYWPIALLLVVGVLLTWTSQTASHRERLRRTRPRRDPCDLWGDAPVIGSLVRSTHTSTDLDPVLLGRIVHPTDLELVARESEYGDDLVLVDWIGLPARTWEPRRHLRHVGTGTYIGDLDHKYGNPDHPDWKGDMRSET